MLPAIVLAAGDSSRMGSPKALLRAPDGRLFIERITATLHEAGSTPVVVITGRHHDAIAAAIRREPMSGDVRLVRNEDPSRGQLSSLWVGMDAVCEADTGGTLVTLIDVPLVRASTIGAVLAAWQRTGAPIVRPRHAGRRGHPVVFDRAVFGELRSAPLEEGARAVVRANLARIVEVEVDDPGCVRDVDTPEEYDRLMRDA